MSSALHGRIVDLALTAETVVVPVQSVERTASAVPATKNNGNPFFS